MIHKPKAGELNISEAPIESLFEDNYRDIFRLVYSITQDIELAKDATQEAFTRAFTNIAKLRDAEKFSSWLKTIAVNTSKEMIYQRYTDSLRHTSIYNDEGEIVESILPKSDSDIPEQVIEQKEMRNEINSCLKVLDYNERMLLLYKYFENLSNAEISEITGNKEGSIRMRLHRLKKKLATIDNQE